MNPHVHTVTSAVTLLCPYLIVADMLTIDSLTKATKEKLQSIYQAIKNKFESDRDEFADKILARLKLLPAVKSRQAVLTDLLLSKVEQDQVFADELRALVVKLSRDQDIAFFVADIYTELSLSPINIDQVVTRARDWCH